MSETEPAPDPNARPWHGRSDPFEAIYADYTAKIAALKSDASTSKIAAMAAEIATLKAQQAKVAADLTPSPQPQET